MCTVVALFAYTANESDELSFEKGDIIDVLSKEANDDDNDGGQEGGAGSTWWLGRVQGTERKGMLPSNFVREATSPSTSADTVDDKDNRKKAGFIAASVSPRDDDTPGTHTVADSSISAEDAADTVLTSMQQRIQNKMQAADAAPGSSQSNEELEAIAHLKSAGVTTIVGSTGRPRAETQTRHSVDAERRGVPFRRCKAPRRVLS